MKSSTNAMSAALIAAGVVGWFAVASLLGVPNALAQEKKDADDKPVVLVPPFENQSKIHQKISYEVGTSNRESRVKREFIVDRFTEAPRSVLEDILGNVEGIDVVERQRIDSFLVETEFGAMSGFVDQDKAVKLGKLLGAKLIVMGTITDIHDDVRDFQGYGVKSRVNDVVCQVRIRLLDIETGTVRFSKIFKGTKTYTQSSFGLTGSTDRYFAAVEVALEKLGDDSKFTAALFGKKAGTAGTDELVEVEFAPTPENCDIEIDGKYVGGSPLKRRLPAGKDVKVRITKDGFKQWEGVISPEKGLKISRELGPDR